MGTNSVGPLPHHPGTNQALKDHDRRGKPDPNRTVSPRSSRRSRLLAELRPADLCESFRILGPVFKASRSDADHFTEALRICSEPRM
jgi:hypothetical protein